MQAEFALLWCSMAPASTGQSFQFLPELLRTRGFFKLSFHAWATASIVALDGRKRKQAAPANGENSTSISVLRRAFYLEKDTLSQQGHITAGGGKSAESEWLDWSHRERWHHHGVGSQPTSSSKESHISQSVTLAKRPGVPTRPPHAPLRSTAKRARGVNITTALLYSTKAGCETANGMPSGEYRALMVPQEPHVEISRIRDAWNQRWVPSSVLPSDRRDHGLKEWLLQLFGTETLISVVGREPLIKQQNIV